MEYTCNCSRERAQNALLLLGRAELESMAAEEVTEMACHFCERKYEFTSAQLMELADACE